jgi:rRNA maturation endonuclease Nob1
MTESNGRWEWELEGYCNPPEVYVKAGFRCSSALPVQPGDVCEQCGAKDGGLMTEEEWEEAQK